MFNAPFSNTRSVVELALAEIISMTRRLTEKNAKMHAGVWDKDADGSHEVRGRTLGIVGYGNIGTQLSVLAENLGMVVYFYDTADKLLLGNARRCETLDELLDVADVVTLHVDGRAGNSGFFGDAQFARMRRGSLFLNLSRGFVVDETALRDHLDQRPHRRRRDRRVPRGAEDQGRRVRLAAARPAQRHPHAAHRRLDRGGAGRHRPLRREQAGRRSSSDGNTTLSVNLPTVALPQQESTHRVAHVHRNMPGVLAQVNSILAAHSVNVEGQLLATRGELGYLLTDIGSEYSDAVLTELRELPATVGLRVLS